MRESRQVSKTPRASSAGKGRSQGTPADPSTAGDAAASRAFTHRELSEIPPEAARSRRRRCSPGET